MTIYRYLDASTGHITQTEMTRIDTGTTPYHTYPSPYGAFIGVPDGDVVIAALAAIDTDDPDLTNLTALVRYAHQADCTLIRIDADGDNTLPLPTFNW